MAYRARTDIATKAFEDDLGGAKKRTLSFFRQARETRPSAPLEPPRWRSQRPKSAKWAF